MLPDGHVERLTDAGRRALLAHVESMASEALRTLACAVRLDTKELADYNGPKHKAHNLLTDPSNFAR